jgi:hypothetical protein
MVVIHCDDKGNWLHQSFPVNK